MPHLKSAASAVSAANYSGFADRTSAHNPSDGMRARHYRTASSLMGGKHAQELLRPC